MAMDTAVFAFQDAAAAQSAVDRLVAMGLPRQALRLHRRPTADDSPALTAIDEQVTGGMVRNAQHLLQGLFDWGSSTIDPKVYAATMDRGGAVVVVEVGADQDRDAVDRVMVEAGVDERTAWTATPGP
jgi:hypothetical protein